MDREFAWKVASMMSAANSESTQWLGLAGRVCVVTGAGNGIGAETVRQLSLAGALVAILDRDGGAAAAVASAIERTGGRAIGVEADVSHSGSVSAAAEQIQSAFGPCQVLVNNAAAVLKADSLMRVDIETWNQSLAVNLTGALICAQAFAAQMINARHGGCIVNVASINGHYPFPNAGGYSVSKAGMLMMSRVLALELAPHGIRSNVVSPGFTLTTRNEKAYGDPDIAAGRRRLVPSGRIGESLDMANAIVFLASDRASYINAQEILVDGGLSQTVMTHVPRPGIAPASGP
jgi:NAD(P)-dependent dehydrogenase (short-subunit alcohol dehydrogenase family)